MRTPIAIRASKGAVEEIVEEGFAVVEVGADREARSVVEPPRRSPALAVEEEEADWIWEAAKRLFVWCPKEWFGVIVSYLLPNLSEEKGKEREKKEEEGFVYVCRKDSQPHLYIPLDTNGEFPRTRDRLDDNVALLHAASQQLRLGAL